MLSSEGDLGGKVRPGRDNGITTCCRLHKIPRQKAQRDSRSMHYTLSENHIAVSERLTGDSVSIHNHNASYDSVRMLFRTLKAQWQFIAACNFIWKIKYTSLFNIPFSAYIFGFIFNHECILRLKKSPVRSSVKGFSFISCRRECQNMSETASNPLQR